MYPKFPLLEITNLTFLNLFCFLTFTDFVVTGQKRYVGLITCLVLKNFPLFFVIATVVDFTMVLFVLYLLNLNSVLLQVFLQGLG